MSRQAYVSSAKTISALRSLADRNGGFLEPEHVVKAARDPKSPLHSKFTWDDTEAAEKYRLYQAGNLIRVVIEYLPDDKSETPMRVFVSLKGDRADGKGYRRTVDVLGKEELRKQLLAAALSDLEMFKERYRKLHELVEIFKAIRKVEKR